MDIDGLRAFLAVVDEGHFGAAADQLRVSQPTLSRRIQRLESTIGSLLLARNLRPVVTTEAGQVLVPYARSIVDAADAATGQLRRLSAGVSRRLRVGYVQSATFVWLKTLATVASAGRIDLDLVAAPSIRQLEAIRTGQLDAGLVRLDSADHELAGLNHRELSRDPLHAVVSDDHPLGTGAVHATDLYDQHLILYPEAEGPGLRRLIRTWLDAGTLRCTDAWDAASAAALAAAGVGIAILPGPLPPLPPRTRSSPLANSPQLTLAFVWHPQRDTRARLLLDRLLADGS